MKLLRRMLRKEAGQTLPMALLLMLLGAMAIIPTLSLATTNLKATSSVNQHTRELYAADAGINNAIWYLQSDNRTQIINPTLQWPKTYWLSDSQPGEKVNSKDVQVKIDTPWLLKSLPGYLTLDTQPAPGTTYNANNDWALIGALNISDNSTYVIQVSTTAATTTTLDNISVWMPQGYSYVTASAQINGVAINGSGDSLHLVKNPAAAQPWRGGNIYKWSYSGYKFSQLFAIAPPPSGSGLTPADKYPPSIQLSFKYTVTPFKQASGFFPWIVLGNQSIAWDSSAGFFHIQSTSFTSGISDNKTIEAYVPRGLPRYTGGTSSATALGGDYIMIGNTLMTACWHDFGTTGHHNYKPGQPYTYYDPNNCNYTDPNNDRCTQFAESSATVDNPNTVVPSDAKIVKAYLYWTGWWTTKDADKQATLSVNGVPVAGGGTVTANTWYVLTPPGLPGYQYACFADVTDAVSAITTAVCGTKFTVGGVSAIPASAPDVSAENQIANASWSMVIIYSSQQVEVHQIYLYDHLAWLYAGQGTFTITGFQAPATGTRDAKVGAFIAEGDPQRYPDYFEFRGQHSPGHYVYLGDPGTYNPSHQTTDKNPWNNIFNDYSSAVGFTPSFLSGESPGTISGVDLECFIQDKDGNSLSNYVLPGDTSANILVDSNNSLGNADAVAVIYVIFSVRSTAVTPGQEFTIGSMLYTVQ